MGGPDAVAGKWRYTEEEITSIVKHMQTLAMLQDQSSLPEQAMNPNKNNDSSDILRIYEKMSNVFSNALIIIVNNSYAFLNQLIMQVGYLRSAMRIASQLTEVNTDGVQPFHNPAELMNRNHFRQDISTVNDTSKRNFDVIMNSKNDKKAGLIVAPAIPASQSSTH